MSEVATNTPRLMAAAKEFNIGTNTLIEFLELKGFGNEELKPGSRLTEQMYRVLQSEFQQDKVAKEKAQKVELSKGAGVTEPKKKRDEEDLSIKKKESAPIIPPPVEKTAEVKPAVNVPPVVEITDQGKQVAEVPEAVAEKPATKKPSEEKSIEPSQKVEITRIDAPELEAPKVVKKIDLDSIDS